MTSIARLLGRPAAHHDAPRRVILSPRGLGSFRRARNGLLGALVVAASHVLLAPTAVVAQTTVPSQPTLEAAAPRRVITPTTADATRAELQALLADAERRGARNDAAAIRSRLQNGDFQVGDQIDLTLTVDSLRREKVEVRAGQLLEFKQLPPLSLAGVLRSELQPTLDRYFRRFYRDPQVRAQPLVRVSIAGSVGKPGQYEVAPDMQLGELIAQANGPTLAANTGKIQVKRGSRTVINKKQYSRAVQQGQTLADVGIRSGDELNVPRRSQFSPYLLLRITVLTLTLLFAIIRLARLSQNY